MKHLLTLFFITTSFGAEPITNSIGMKFAPILPSSFIMGQDGPAADYQVKKHAEKFDDADWDEKPVHRVTMTQLFHLGTTEVTVAQYRQFAAKHPGQNDDDAVTNVSWNDAVKFCDWLSKKEGKTYRLPTEAEWEFTCRAGSTTLFHAGDALPAGFHSWPTDSGQRDRFFPDEKLPPEYLPKFTKLSLKIAQKSANAWGLYDMHGNVSEWCADWYGPYEADEQSDPMGRVEGDFRVIRGGSHSTQTRLLRSANRTSWLPAAVNDRIGFRVVLGDWPKSAKLPLPKPALNAQGVNHFYSQSTFSTKIFSSGLIFKGYVGMDPYAIGTPGAAGPASSSPNALSATPYAYLIPTGADVMRAPPLGDTNVIRSWTVRDQALPLPKNLGATAFSALQVFTPQGTLNEQLWITRKHQAFRAVDDQAYFYSSMPSEFTNSRLISRSAWNTRWKIVIPAYSLLSNEQVGLDRFIQSVSDIKLFLRTYSNSGN